MRNGTPGGGGGGGATLMENPLYDHQRQNNSSANDTTGHSARFSQTHRVVNRSGRYFIFALVLVFLPYAVCFRMALKQKENIL